MNALVAQKEIGSTCLMKGKKVAIMHPYFFPYVGYFALLDYADAFILFDTAQYDRKGWMHRNRILKPVEGWQYIRAGVLKPEFKARIQDVILESSADWKVQILRQLEHYKKMAPNYQRIMDLVKMLFDRPAETLTVMNYNILTGIRDYLGMECPIQIFSEMNIHIEEPEHAGQWAPRISGAVGAKEYVNPIGGKAIFNKNDFRDAGVSLRFLEHQLSEYDQRRRDFVPGLSVLDCLMFLSVDGMVDYIKSYELS